jgi:hypothetical protein
MDKSRLSVKGKLFNSGLNSLVVATSVKRAVATTIATTTPAEHTTGPLTAPTPVPIVDVAEDKVAEIDLKMPEELLALKRNSKFWLRRLRL